MLKKILTRMNWLVFTILVVYPILLLVLGVSYARNHSIGIVEIGLIIAGYYGSNIAVGVGLHRLWSHHSFKTNKFIEFLLMMMSSGTLQGPVMAWASDHDKHHTYTDKEKDPHTPLKFENKILGFLWSHIGWMLFSQELKNISRSTLVKLGKNRMLIWQMKYYWQLAVFMNTLVPAFIGYLIGGTLFSAYIGFLFIGIGRAFQQQFTFCVNSACHFFGSKKYYKGTAGDIWWLAIFLLGENWHNYHHAFPSDYRNGAKWYHFDVHKWIIYAMSAFGLAWDLDRTSDTRVQAKMNETRNYLIEGKKEQITVLQEKIEGLTNRLCLALDEMENSSTYIKAQITTSLLDMQKSVIQIAEQLKTFEALPAEKLLKIASKNLRHTEKMVYNLYNKLEKVTSSAVINLG